MGRTIWISSAGSLHSLKPSDSDLATQAVVRRAREIIVACPMSAAAVASRKAAATPDARREIVSVKQNSANATKPESIPRSSLTASRLRAGCA